MWTDGFPWGGSVHLHCLITKLMWVSKGHFETMAGVSLESAVGLKSSNHQGCMTIIGP